MRHAIVIERAESNYSAYVADLPSCFTTSATIAEVEQGIREASPTSLACGKTGSRFHSHRAKWNTSTSLR
jgi:hypothetical protein